MTAAIQSTAGYAGEAILDEEGLALPTTADLVRRLVLFLALMVTIFVAPFVVATLVLL